MAHILVADDDPQIRRLLKQILEIDGHEIIAAADGNEAMKTALHSPPQILITDLYMPNKDGLETILEFRKRFPLTKIIIISGGGRHGNYFVHTAKSLGADLTMKKPLQSQQILQAVEELLQDPGKQIQT